MNTIIARCKEYLKYSLRTHIEGRKHYIIKIEKDNIALIMPDKMCDVHIQASLLSKYNRQ